MQKFGHFAVYLEHALSGIGRIVKRGNDIARMRYLLRIGRENGVAQAKLAGVDERFAVKAHFHALPALGFKRSYVSDIVEHAVQDAEAVTPRRQHRQRQRRLKRRPLGHERGPVRVATATPASLKLSNKPQRVPAKTPRTPKTPAAASSAGAAEKVAPRSCPSRVDVMKDTNGRPRSARADLKPVVGAGLASAATPRAIASARGAQKAEKKGSVLVQPRWM